MKRLITFLTLLTLLFTTAWAKTTTLTQKVLEVTVDNSYISGEKTLDGITYIYTDLRKFGTAIQVKGGSGAIYNSTPFPGDIAYVVINYSNNMPRVTTIWGSSDGDKWDEVVTASAPTGSFNNDVRTITGDFQGKGYKYFKITRGTSTSYWTDVRIIYTTGDSGGTNEYVDLGLPSRTLWATKNIGASRPEEYGQYFAWGETKPKEVYNYNSYQLSGDSWNTMTKYCTSGTYGTVHNKTELDPKDDAATVNWGPNWCMPTQTQINELLKECTWTWTTENGIEGYQVSKNGKSIFLPAAGFRDGNAYYENNIDRHTTYYWSRTLDTEISNQAYDFWFYWKGNTENSLTSGSNARYDGYAIRAVRVDPGDGYYLVGNFNMLEDGTTWITKDVRYKFSGEGTTLSLDGITLPDNVEFKIVKWEGATLTWYGGETDDTNQQNYYRLHRDWHTDIPLTDSYNNNYVKNFFIDGGAVTNFTLDTENMKFDIERIPQLYVKGNFNSWANEAMTATADGWTINKEISATNEFGFVDEWGDWHGGKGYWIYQNDHEVDGQTVPSDMDKPLSLKNDGNFYMVDDGNYALNVNSGLTELVVSIVPISLSLADLESGAVNVKSGYPVTFNHDLFAVKSGNDGNYSYLWCKDAGPSVNPSKVDPNNLPAGMEDYMVAHGNFTSEEWNGEWDESNWIALKFNKNLDMSGHENRIIKANTVTGKFDDNFNFALVMSTNTLEEETSYTYTYSPNWYCPANFIGGNQHGNATGHSEHTTDKHYFFMNPKVQEYCMVTFAVWNGTRFVLPAPQGVQNDSNIPGAVNVEWAFNGGAAPKDLLTNQAYKFKAIVYYQKARTQSLKDDNSVTPGNYDGYVDENYIVYPIDFDPQGSIITTIDSIEVGGKVKSVKYYNTLGIVSDRPFKGVNIVVTEYTDGSRTTTKILK
jgi:hypothetical protein